MQISSRIPGDVALIASFKLSTGRWHNKDTTHEKKNPEEKNR
jgi:hypothetical protein